MKKHVQSFASKSDINITPFIDILLVLLVPSRTADFTLADSSPPLSSFLTPLRI